MKRFGTFLFRNHNMTNLQRPTHHRLIRLKPVQPILVILHLMPKQLKLWLRNLCTARKWWTLNRPPTCFNLVSIKTWNCPLGMVRSCKQRNSCPFPSSGSGCMATKFSRASNGVTSNLQWSKSSFALPRRVASPGMRLKLSSLVW